MPVIAVDTREQDPLEFPTFPTKVATLQSGDYSVQGGELHFAVERKSLPDLVTSLTRERDRFCRELHRLRGFDFATSRMGTYIGRRHVIELNLEEVA